MERNKGFRSNNSGNFSSRGRNNDFSKPWSSNFDQQNSPGIINPWIQNNPQMNPNTNNWQENQNRNAINPWVTGFDSNNSNRNQSIRNANHSISVWQQNSTNDNGYWRQTSGGNTQNEREWQYNTSRDRRRTPYDRPNKNGPNRGTRGDRQKFNNEQKRDSSPENQSNSIPLTPLEAKIERLITAVQNQPDNLGQLILLQNNNEIPPVLLNNAAHQVKNCVLVIDRDESSGYSKLRINNTVICEGMYSSKKDAKEALYEMGLDILKSKCFYITSKSHYEEVSMDDLNNQKKVESENTMDGNSKAVQMMLKMGWGGKGLGTKEQGEQKSVADKIIENISREGLGTGGQTVMQEVDKILADYARSTKTITLGFDSAFTKEERAQIHSIAGKYHLKSKSEGGYNNRRITISKKMSKWVLVRELLSVGLENESYILTIPDDFKELWTQDE